jgi:hypothetical protein
MAISDLLEMRCQSCKMPWYDLGDFERVDVRVQAVTLQDPLRFSVCQCWIVCCNICLTENVIPWVEI